MSSFLSQVGLKISVIMARIDLKAPYSKFSIFNGSSLLAWQSAVQ